MSTVKQMAEAFRSGKKLAHRSVTLMYPMGVENACEYRLHGNVICRQYCNGVLVFDWCGWYGPTTANHINHILKAFNCDMRVGYASYRDTATQTFGVNYDAQM